MTFIKRGSLGSGEFCRCNFIHPVTRQQPMKPLAIFCLFLLLATQAAAQGRFMTKSQRHSYKIMQAFCSYYDGKKYDTLQRSEVFKRFVFSPTPQPIVPLAGKINESSSLTGYSPGLFISLTQWEFIIWMPSPQPTLKRIPAISVLLPRRDLEAYINFSPTR